MSKPLIDKPPVNRLSSTVVEANDIMHQLKIAYKERKPRRQRNNGNQ